jgi:hypothetical protein
MEQFVRQLLTHQYSGLCATDRGKVGTSTGTRFIFLES